jgi:hypothetical protein
MEFMEKAGGIVSRFPASARLETAERRRRRADARNDRARRRALLDTLRPP